MADGAVIVGVTGILTTGVLAPLVGARVAALREERIDRRQAVDAASEALTSAREAAEFSFSALNAGLGDPQDAEWRVLRDNTACGDQLHKLELRFGASAAIPAAYEQACKDLKGLEYYTCTYLNAIRAGRELSDRVGSDLEERWRKNTAAYDNHVREFIEVTQRHLSRGVLPRLRSRD